VGEGIVRGSLAQQARRDQPLEDLEDPGIVLDGLQQRAGLDVVEDDGHPRMVGRAAEAAKWRAEDEMADQVKGGPVVRLDEVDGWVMACASLVQQAYELV